MLKSDVDLDRLKTEILEYLGTGSVPIFYCFGVPGEEGHVYWDSQQRPDWRQFIDVARDAGAKLFLFTCHELEADELDGARDTLADVEMEDGDREDASEFLNKLRSHVGHVAWLRIAWQQDSRRYALEHVAPWYEKFLDLAEEMGEYLPEMSEDEDDDESGRGGFYSLN